METDLKSISLSTQTALISVLCICVHKIVIKHQHAILLITSEYGNYYSVVKIISSSF